MAAPVDTNTPFQVPKFQPAVKKLLSRGRFLDGTITTYFGPGQPPDSFVDVGLPDIGVDEYGIPDGSGFTSTDALTYDQTVTISKTYAPPGDWPPAGYLLRLPQVVYLSNGFGSWAPGFIYSSPDPSVDATLALPATGPFGACAGAIDLIDFRTAPAAYQALAVNLGDIYRQVKDAIEAMRPGRTWVQVINWGLWAPSTTTGDFTYINWNQYTYNGQVLPLLCPTMTDPFVGSEFLHIWAGSYYEQPTPDEASSGDYPEDIAAYTYTQFLPLWCWDSLAISPLAQPDDTIVPHTPTAPITLTAPPTLIQTVGTPTTFGTDFSLDETRLAACVPYVAAGSIYQNSLSLVQAAYPVFSKFGVRLYGMDEYTDPGAPAVGSQFECVSGDARILTNTGYASDYEWEWTLIPQFWIPQTLAAGGLFASAMFDQMASDFSDFNVEHSGGTSAITVDSLVRQIADFFGFDPTTGKDIPKTP